MGTLFFLIMTLLQAGAFAFVACEFGRYRGFADTQLAYLMAGILSFVLGMIVFGNTFHLFAGFAFAFATAIAGKLYAAWMQADIKRQLDMAATVAEFGLANYDRLNPDAQGLSAGGLNKLVESGGFDPWTTEIVRHMASKMKDIGREVDSMHVRTSADGTSGVVRIYQANRDDLTTYPARIAARYAPWVVAMA